LILPVVVILLDWNSKQSANAAARVKQTLARHMGYITLDFSDVSAETLAALTAPFHVIEPYRTDFYCSDDGEYPSDGSFQEEQIQLTRLMDGLSNGSLQTAPDSLSPVLLHHLYALQQPGTSNWKIPFIRVFFTS